MLCLGLCFLWLYGFPGTFIGRTLSGVVLFLELYSSWHCILTGTELLFGHCTVVFLPLCYSWQCVLPGTVIFLLLSILFLALCFSVDFVFFLALSSSWYCALHGNVQFLALISSSGTEHCHPGTLELYIFLELWAY